MSIGICAGIVTYNPFLPELRKNLQAVSIQVPVVVIIDNGSSNIREIRNLIRDFPHIKLITNTVNKGLGFALNQAMQYGYDHSYPYVLLLDQDSLVSTNLISEYLRFINPTCSIISPQIIDKNKSRYKPAQRQDYEYTKRPITSGSLISTSIWHKLGGFDTSLFIEFIDYEYDERSLQAGYKLIQVNTAHLLQEGGHAQRLPLISGFGDDGHGKIHLQHPYRYNYPPSRYYYRFRNNLIFIRRYMHRPVPKIKESLILAKRLIHDSLLEKNRIENWRQIYHGLKDGFCSPLYARPNWTNQND
ncbi:MAG: glycosyltransferase [Bifidobacterium sp.]|nr:glycosyltransferase [Bifidobacterium sp.]